MRAVCRIGYRYNNDSNYVGSGYGWDDDDDDEWDAASSRVGRRN